MIGVIPECRCASRDNTASSSQLGGAWCWVDDHDDDKRVMTEPALECLGKHLVHEVVPVAATRRPQLDLILYLQGATSQLEVVDDEPVALAQLFADDCRDCGRFVESEVGLTSEVDDVRSWTRVGVDSQHELGNGSKVIH